METIPYMMMFIYIAFFTISAVIVIYLIIKRIKNQGKKEFEERDN